MHNDCPHCGAPGRFPHGIWQYPVCPIKNRDTLHNRGLTGLSTVDGIVTHDNQHVPEMVVAFAQTLPVAAPIVDVDTLISDDKTKVDKAFAGANLAINIFAFFTLGARSVGASGAYDEVFQAGSVTKHTRPVSNAVNAVETGAQFSGGRTARNIASEIAEEASFVRKPGTKPANPLTDPEALSQAMQMRQLSLRTVDPSELKGAHAWLGGTTGHPGKHGFDLNNQVHRQVMVDVINNPDHRIIGVYDNSNRAVNIFHKDGTVVITEGGDILRVITTFGTKNKPANLDNFLTDLHHLITW